MTVCMFAMHPAIVHDDGGRDDRPPHRQVRRNKRKLSSTVSCGDGGTEAAAASTPKRAKHSHSGGGDGGGSENDEGGHSSGGNDAPPHRRPTAGAATTTAGRAEGTSLESATDPSSATTSSYALSDTTLFLYYRRPPQSSGDSVLASARIARVLAGPKCCGSHGNNGNNGVASNGIERLNDAVLRTATISSATTGRRKMQPSLVMGASAAVAGVNASVADGVDHGGNGDVTHSRSSGSGDAVVTPPLEPSPPRMGQRTGNGNGAPSMENNDALSGAATNASSSTSLVVRGRSEPDVANRDEISHSANLALPPEDDSEVANALAVVEGHFSVGSGSQHGRASESTTMARKPRRRGLCSTVLLVCGLLVLAVAAPLATLAVLAARDVVRSRGRAAEQLRFELLEARQELAETSSARGDDASALAEARYRLEAALGSKDDASRALREAWGRMDDLASSNDGLTTELVEARTAVGALAAERDALASARDELSTAVSRTFQLELDAVAHGQLVREWTSIQAQMEDEIELLRERLARQEEEAVLAIDAVVRAAHRRGGEEMSAWEGRCALEVDRQGRIAADAINAVAMAATA